MFNLIVIAVEIVTNKYKNVFKMKKVIVCCLFIVVFTLIPLNILPIKEKNNNPEVLDEKITTIYQNPIIAKINSLDLYKTKLELIKNKKENEEELDELFDKAKKLLIKAEKLLAKGNIRNPDDEEIMKIFDELEEIFNRILSILEKGGFILP
jgi:hypothetical protein